MSRQSKLILEPPDLSHLGHVVTPDEIRNEHLKLSATWLNNLSAGIIAAGTFVPAAQVIFNLLPLGTDNGLVVGVGLVCFVTGFAIHLAGHVFLGSLR